ncbi:MAG: hypothetical protein E6Q50_17205 [Lysobacter sp.]|nr:MAG: hypothetical protein E6Q50_17205 [Lysobacter sp.]
MKNIVNLILVCTLIVFVAGCKRGESSCAPYEHLANDKEVISTLKLWIDGEFSKSLESIELNDPGAMVHEPGSFLVKNSPNLEGIGFPPNSVARVIMNEHQMPAAIFFGHRSMHGVIISMSSAGDVLRRFGVVSDNMHVISDRVAYVCYQRD